MNTDNDIVRLWSEGKTRPEIAAATGASLVYVRHVVREARRIEAAEVARYKRIHMEGARSELGALARANHLPYSVVYGRWKVGKRGAALIEPVRPYGVPKVKTKNPALIHALPADTPSLDDVTIGMIAMAKFNHWPVGRICRAFDVHPRQVQVIRAAAPASLHEMRWSIAGEFLTVEEIAVRSGVPMTTIEARIRRGWRGLQLMQPLLRVRE